MTFVVKVTGTKYITVGDETVTETETGYVTSRWGSGEAMAPDISGAKVFTLTSADVGEDGMTWTGSPVQGLPSVSIINDGSNPYIEVYTYEIVETHVYATVNGQDDIDVSGYFIKKIEGDPENQIGRASCRERV